MPRLTKAQENETTRVYYGINRDTCEIELVFLHRNGRLTNHSASPSSCYVTNNSDAESEIRLTWHLTELVSYLPGMDNNPGVKRDIEDLKEKAAAMKAAKAGDTS